MFPHQNLVTPKKALLNSHRGRWKWLMGFTCSSGPTLRSYMNLKPCMWMLVQGTKPEDQGVVDIYAWVIWDREEFWGKGGFIGAIEKVLYTLSIWSAFKDGVNLWRSEINRILAPKGHQKNYVLVTLCCVHNIMSVYSRCSINIGQVNEVFAEWIHAQWIELECGSQIYPD